MSRELFRVPMDFDWPLNLTWAGFENPFYQAKRECRACGASGLAPVAKRFHDQWYGQAEFDPVVYGARPIDPDDPAIRAMAKRHVEDSPDFYAPFGMAVGLAVVRETRRLWDLFRGQWYHHLIQADVDALWAEERLWDFRGAKPTPDEVNAWSIGGMGHDSINASICLSARCEREGVEKYCPECKGEGSTWPSRAHQKLYDDWQKTPPPRGQGYQVWETVSEGSPVSPVFPTAEAAIDWLVGEGYDRDAARRFVEDTGWDPSMVIKTGAEGAEFFKDIDSLTASADEGSPQ